MQGKGQDLGWDVPVKVLRAWSHTAPCWGGEPCQVEGCCCRLGSKAHISPDPGIKFSCNSAQINYLGPMIPLCPPGSISKHLIASWILGRGQAVCLPQVMELGFV